jgi:nucleoside-diphosphate-sugar epimerase
MNPVFIIGCGDIGRRLATLLQGVQVVGVVRSEASVERLQVAGITPFKLDLDDTGQFVRLTVAAAQVYYFAPPPAQGEVDSRVQAACASWRDGRRPQRLVYISTSAVYGDCNGAWIDETAPLRPGTARGRRRLDAEQRWLDWGESQQVPVVILRVAGIYAHDKLPVKRLREGLPVLREADAPFTNRIHADDLARVCLLAMQRGKSGSAYNVSDGHPSSMTDYFNRVADCLGLPRPPTVDRAQAEQQLSAAMLSFLGESKRLDNRRLISELGVQLHYPTLAEGLAAAAVEQS